MARQTPNQAMSLDQLIESHYEALFRYCLRKSGSHDVAQEVVQETFVKAFLGDIVQQHPNPVAWLFSVAMHDLCDRARTGARRNELLKAAPSRPPQEPPDGPADAEERIQAVRQALDELPEDQREAMTLRLYGDLTSAEIAEVMSKPGAKKTEGAVNSLLHRAREALREKLGDWREDYDA